MLKLSSFSFVWNTAHLSPNRMCHDGGFASTFRQSSSFIESPFLIL